jgi:hypothetical protein
LDVHTLPALDTVFHASRSTHVLRVRVSRSSTFLMIGRRSLNQALDSFAQNAQ